MTTYVFREKVYNTEGSYRFINIIFTDALLNELVTVRVITIFLDYLDNIYC